MTKRTSKAAGIVPAAAAAAAVAAVIADGAQADAEGERPNEEAGAASAGETVSGASSQEGAAASDGPIASTDILASNDLPPPPPGVATLDPANPHVALALLALDRIRGAASAEEAFAAVIDAAALVALATGFSPFPDAPGHMSDPFETQGMDLATKPDQTALVDMDLAGRVLQVRALAPNGRRRAGYAFGSEPQPVNVDDLSEEQLAAILSDGHLAVQVTD